MIMPQKVGIAGYGAIGSVVGQALLDGTISDHILGGIYDHHPEKVPSHYKNGFQDLVNECDILVEAIPPNAAAEFAKIVFEAGKDLVLISSCALLLYPDILENLKKSNSHVFIPAGALSGIQNINSLKSKNIKSCTITSTKPSAGFLDNLYFKNLDLDMGPFETPVQIFKGNAVEAAQHFPKNVNVSATLSYCGTSFLGPLQIQVIVKVHPDPNTGNTHNLWCEFANGEIFEGETINKPDPNNPKTSINTALSLVETLQNRDNALVRLSQDNICPSH